MTKNTEQIDDAEIDLRDDVGSEGSLHLLQKLGFGCLVTAVIALCVSVAIEFINLLFHGWPLHPLEDGILAGIIFIIIAFLFFLVYEVISFRSKSREDKQSSYRFFLYQLVTFGILMLSLRAFGLHHTPKSAESAAATVTVTNSNSSEEKKEGQPVLVTKLTLGDKQGPSTASEDTNRNIAEMAAIMILFLLAELAAFIAHDLNKTKTMVQELGKTAGDAAWNTRTAATTLLKSLDNINVTNDKLDQMGVVARVQNLHSFVRSEANALIGAWGMRAESKSDTGDQRQLVTERIWKILLKEYLKEEFAEFSPNEKVLADIPKSVLPINNNFQDISFIATSVGFYAKLLTSIVQGFTLILDQDRGRKQQYGDNKRFPKSLGTSEVDNGTDKRKLCMAIVTNALPAHCWNWAKAEGNWCSYDPINSYRESMSAAVKAGAHIDRVLLVYQDGLPQGAKPLSDDAKFFEAYKGVYWREELLKEMMSNWYLLSKEDEEDYTPQPSSSNFKKSGKGTLFTQAYSDFPLPVRQAANQDAQTFFPMIKLLSPPNERKEYTAGIKKWKIHKLYDEYLKLHVSNDNPGISPEGTFWRFPVTEKEILQLGGRHDIMFIGLGERPTGSAGLWTKEGKGAESVDWGICLMSSMNSVTQTMFLTVISGESVQSHFDHFQGILHDNICFTANRLLRPDN